MFLFTTHHIVASTIDSAMLRLLHRDPMFLPPVMLRHRPDSSNTSPDCLIIADSPRDVLAARRTFVTFLLLPLCGGSSPSFRLGCVVIPVCVSSGILCCGNPDSQRATERDAELLLWNLWGYYHLMLVSSWTKHLMCILSTVLSSTHAGRHLFPVSTLISFIHVCRRCTSLTTYILLCAQICEVFRCNYSIMCICFFFQEVKLLWPLFICYLHFILWSPIQNSWNTQVINCYIG